MQFRTTLLVAILLFGALGTTVRAQGLPPAGGQRLEAGVDYKTRATLEADATKAETQNRASEAWVLRNRLKNGDFNEGDKIIVVMLGLLGSRNPNGDTATVRAGRLLPFPQLGDMALEGVLRSELQDKVHEFLSNYVKDASVRVVPLMRLGVLGQVRNPNYFYVPTDILLNDLLGRAGGPNQAADVENMTIRRGSDILWGPADLRTAMSDGLSLERLDLRDGDQLYLDDMSHSVNFTRTMQFIAPMRVFK